jgi:hypothetical protein
MTLEHSGKIATGRFFKINGKVWLVAGEGSLAQDTWKFVDVHGTVLDNMSVNQPYQPLEFVDGFE